MKSTILTAAAVAQAAVSLLPERDLDYFYWPAIPGETYPPDFVASGTPGIGEYTIADPFPSVRVGNGGAAGLTTASALWGPLPLYRPGRVVFSGIRVSWRLLVESMTAAGAAGFSCATIGCLVQQVGVNIACGPTNVALPPLTVGQWYSFATTITAAGLFTASMDGVPVASGPGTIPTTVLRPNLGTNGISGEGATVHGTTIRVDYL